MAKHPVPKQRSSSTRSRSRHSTWKTNELKRLTKLSRTVPCPKCKQPRRPHTACGVCGYYRGRVVIDLAAKDAKKVKTIKA